MTSSTGEDARTDADERFRVLIQDSADVVTVLAPDGTISFLSPSSDRVFGESAESVQQQSALDFVHPDDRGRATVEFATLFGEPGGQLRTEVRITRRDGDVRVVEINARNLVDEPHVHGIVCNLRDVTERRRAEDALRESENRLRQVLDHSRDALAVLDVNTCIEWTSPAVSTLLGYPPEELLGMMAFSIVHPDDLALGLSIGARAFTSGTEVAPVVMRMRHRDGEWIPVETAAGVVLGDGGDVRSLIINLRDVSRRVAAEEAVARTDQRFRSLVEHSGAIAEIVDENGIIRWISDNVHDVLGYWPEEMIGHFAGDFSDPETVPRDLEEVRTILASPGATVTLESRVRRKDGEWRWMEITFTNRLSDPSVNGVIGNFRDITDRRVAEEALRASEKLFRSVSQSSPTGVFQQGADRNCVYVNQRWQEITGYTFDEALGHGWRRIIHPDDRERLGVDEPDRPLDTIPVKTEFRVVRPNGVVRWVSVSTAPTVDDQGRITGMVGTLDDVTDRIAAQRDNQRLIDIFEATSDLVGISDPFGTLLYANRAAREFLGLAEHGPLENINLLDRFPGDRMEMVTDELIPALDRDGVWGGEITLLRGDGTPAPMLAQLHVHTDSDGRFEFLSAVLRDISERKQFESVLHHQATHDPLTGLPNRSLLLDRLSTALTQAKRTGLRVALLFLDLDHFKVVNDSLGHALGDKLLIAISERLKTAMRPGDLIARFGGDEFVLLCENLHGQQDAAAIADRVLSAVSGPFTIDETEVFVGLSIGIAFPTDPDAEPANLIRDADAAMYRAKEKGRARFEVFDNAMRAHAVDRLDIENALRRAIERRELRVHYQPIVRIGSDPSGAVHAEIDGVEALLRWEHPDRGLLLPNEFIGIAEETGLIVAFGAWVLDQSCRQVQRWQASIPGLPPLKLSVNLSGRQLAHPALVDDVRQVLADTGIAPGSVEFEITESVLMDDVDRSEETLGDLKRLGVMLSVDDFGTGYSSLSYLRRFPVDVLKVDRSFVDGLGSDPSDSAIVTAIITLAHNLGMEAVAEGVESRLQLDELRRLECDLAQGFYFARPAAGDAVAELLSRWKAGLELPSA